MRYGVVLSVRVSRLVGDRLVGDVDSCMVALVEPVAVAGIAQLVVRVRHEQLRVGRGLQRTGRLAEQRRPVVETCVGDRCLAALKGVALVLHDVEGLPSKGQSVKIISGPFKDMEATVQKIDLNSKKVEVIIKVFKKDTPVSLHYNQIKRK